MASLTTSEAAAQLGISPERIRVIIANGELEVDRRGAINLVDTEAVTRYGHNRPMHRGRPLSQATAWHTIRLNHPLDTDNPDRQRRRLRPRAQFGRYRYTPERYNDIVSDDRLVISSRSAALTSGVGGFEALPDDPRTPTVTYVRNRDLSSVVEAHRLRRTNNRATLVLAMVHDDLWPFTPGQRYVDLGVAWLDLEDERDRAADITATYWKQHR